MLAQIYKFNLHWIEELYDEMDNSPRRTLNPFKHSASHYRSNRSQSAPKFRYINQQSKYNSKEPYKMLMLTKQ